MYNKLCAFIRTQNMLCPKDTVICAVSGGADSMALLWSMYLLKEKLGITLEAAHFNHHLRGQESDRDAAFVQAFCDGYGIRLHMGSAAVQKGQKGLEAAAREARYAFFRSLSGKIATAHTADDNAETVLINLIRGSGLRGLGAIAPVGERLIRPMLTVTRQEVLQFLQEYHIPHVEDGSNAQDDFLRNRIRHHVMPLLTQENPRLAENMSAMALRLRQDEACLEAMAQTARTNSVKQLRQLEQPLRNRLLETFLKENGVREPSARHIAQMDALVFSEDPSARAIFPGGITIGRCYDCLQVYQHRPSLETRQVPCPGQLELPELGMRLVCSTAASIIQSRDTFTVCVQGKLILRCRQSGDEIRLSGGTKSLKKLFVDAKIPVSQRMQIPVLQDDGGIVGVWGFGVHGDRAATQLPAMQLRFETIEK